MATSTCLKCGSHRFEATPIEPQGSRFRLTAIQCSGCGGVVGVMDAYNIGHYVKQIAEKLGIR